MSINLQGYDLPAPVLTAISEIVQAYLNSGDLITPAGITQGAADLRYVRTVNGSAPDGSGNVVVAGGGGSALPTAIAPVTAIPLDGNKVFNADTVMSSTALTIAAGQVEGGSCSLVIKGDGSSTWGGITGASKSSGSATFSNTLNAVNHVLVWVDRGRVRYTISQSDPIEIASTPVAPTNTVPTIVTATAGSALVFTGGSASGSPTPTTVYSWRTSGGTLVQDNITSGSYTPPGAGNFILRMTSVNSVNTDIDDVAVTVSAAATAPGAPTVSNATSISATGLTYTWADGSNGGSAITGRNADISFDGGTTWTAIATPVVGANTITFASSGSARTAQIRGRATNSVGPGSYGTLTGIAVPAEAPTSVRFGAVPTDVVESGSGPYTYTLTTSAPYTQRDLTSASMMMPASAASELVFRLNSLSGGTAPFMSVSLSGSNDASPTNQPFGSNMAENVAMFQLGNGGVGNLEVYIGSSAATGGAGPWCKFSRAADGVVTLSRSTNGTTWVTLTTTPSTAAAPLYIRGSGFGTAAGNSISLSFESQAGLVPTV